MSYLIKVREAAGLSQLDAARQLGVSRQFLARLEQGHALPSREQAAALRGFYGVPVLEADCLLDRGERRLRARLSPYALLPVDPTPWRTAWQDYGYTLQAMGLDPDVWRWMSHFLPADSARECYSLGQVAALGARPMLGNPNHWDFLDHVVVDHLGMLPGARLFPGLLYTCADTELWLWPQTRLRIDARSWFRLDGLLSYRKGSRGYWFDYEVDAKGHDFRGDSYRAERLGLLEVRLTGEEVGSGKAAQLLLERIEARISAHLSNPAALRSAPTRMRRVSGDSGMEP